MHRRHLLAVVTCSISIVVSTNLFAWEYRVEESHGSSTAEKVAIDVLGDVFAAGRENSQATVSKISGSDGSEVWRAAGSFFEPSAMVVVDEFGDLFARERFRLAKLSGHSGHELWSRPVVWNPNWPLPVVVPVDAADVVTVEGREIGGEVRDARRIVRLSGRDGTEVWRSEQIRDPSGAVQITHVVLSPAGKILVVGTYHPSQSPSQRVGIWKLRTETGAIVWRSDTVPASRIHHAAVAPGGEIFIGGGLPEGFEIAKFSPSGAWQWTRAVGNGRGDFRIDAEGHVVAVSQRDQQTLLATKLDGGSGSLLWEAEFEAQPRADAGGDILPKIALDPNGNPIVGAPTDHGGVFTVDPDGGFFVPYKQSGGDVLVAKLAAENGEVIWLSHLSGTSAIYPDELNQLATDALGDVFAAGFVSRCQDAAGFSVTKLSGMDGSFAGAEPIRRDRDGDGVTDECDNCVDVYNPALRSLEPAARLSGGQLDQDGDGFGNACDAKFVSGGGPVGLADLAEMVSSFGARLDGNTCGTNRETSCRNFDLDGSGQTVGGPDLIRSIELLGSFPGPKCDRCPLEAEWGF